MFLPIKKNQDPEAPIPLPVTVSDENHNAGGTAMELVTLLAAVAGLWAGATANPPSIKVTGLAVTPILGQPHATFGVEPDKIVSLNCSHGTGNVTWDIPLVEEKIQIPNTPALYITSNTKSRFSTLQYYFITPNSTGLHQCSLTEDSNSTTQVYLEVSENSTCKIGFRMLLPEGICYKGYNIKRQWEEAQSYCRREGTQLAVPTSQRMLKALQEIADFDDNDDKVWVGIKKTGGSWWNVEGTMDTVFNKWASGMPQGEGDCVLLTYKGTIEKGCDYNNSFICERMQVNATCPRGYRVVPGIGCYYRVRDAVTWEEAQERCSNSRAHLAVPNSQQEFDILMSMRNILHWSVWLGIKRNGTTWVTVKGQLFNDYRWAPMMSSIYGACAYANRQGLDNGLCKGNYKFICEYIKGDLYGHTVTPVPTLMTDPPFSILSIGVISALIVTVIIASILGPITLILCMKLRRQRELRRVLLHGDMDNLHSNKMSLVDRMQLLPFYKRWEFPFKQLTLGECIGAGEFGIVKKAEACFITPGEAVTTVAVKTISIRADMSCLKALVLEMKILAHLGHHLNIVNLLGACTKDIGKGRFYMIVEYCSFGNLATYLSNHQKLFVNQLDPITKTLCAIANPRKEARLDLMHSKSGKVSNDEINSRGGDENTTQTIPNTYLDADCVATRDLICWSYQVSKGMEYLTSRKVMHGDLAARNVLLAANNVVKICDFGLARNLHGSSYYKKKDDDLLPIKWMAPEALKEQIFSTQSDVWAFGILLWEIFSLGASPYPDVHVSELTSQLHDGYRMGQPELAPNEIYSVMVQCWQTEPDQRPAFSVLSDDLAILLGKSVVEHYMTLNSPYMKLNAENTERDYLSEMSAPDYKNSVLPNHYSKALRKTQERGPLPLLPVQESQL